MLTRAHEGRTAVTGSAPISFDAFCTEHHAPVRRALIVSFGSADLGSEAADEAFARAFARWQRVGRMTNPAGWTYTVGLNWGRRHLVRRRRERDLLAAVDTSNDSSGDLLDVDLVRALGTLPLKLRSVVVLRKVLDLSEAETANALGIPPGTVKSRLNRALASLRDQLNSPTEERDTHE